MQEGDGFFKKLARDLTSVVGVDSRPLLFAFAMCGGAGTYLSVPFEPRLEEICGLMAVALLVLFLVRWAHRPDLSYALTVCLLVWHLVSLPAL